MSNSSEEESHNNLQQKQIVPSSILKKNNCTYLRYVDPDAEVIALSPHTLLATNRYICEVCHKGFQRDQNLQLHRRGHNLPWKLKQRSSTESKKRVYVCPEVSCTHHDPSRALGDLTGIKKHYSRKHGEKKWKCDKCSKRYAVQSDWKAHSKICGTKEYRCDCGTIFSRKDSFVTHRAFCDAMAEENARVNHSLTTMVGNLQSQPQDMLSHSMPSLSSSTADTLMNSSTSDQNPNNPLRSLSLNPLIERSSEMLSSQIASKDSWFQLSGGGSSSHYMPMGSASAYMSATALLQKAAELGAKASDDSLSPILLRGFTGYSTTTTRFPRSVREPVNDHFETSGLMWNVPNLGNQSTFQTNSKGNRNDNDTHEGEMQQGNNFHQEISRERDVRMTQDFLGLGPVGTIGISGHSYDNDPVVLNYSDGQQDNQQDIYSYHQMPHGSTALEKPMWDF
uniref:Protein EARLY HEADING DATE 2 n=1 Tax=Ananas comosus var. bracteatus TaxID=296719 RepID=A0A6V7Q131_ANACO|nr:unnamed protein product [Ananas comosus var. bracteatus]